MVCCKLNLLAQNFTQKQKMTSFAESADYVRSVTNLRNGLNMPAKTDDDDDDDDDVVEETSVTTNTDDANSNSSNNTNETVQTDAMKTDPAEMAAPPSQMSKRTTLIQVDKYNGCDICFFVSTIFR